MGTSCMPRVFLSRSSKGEVMHTRNAAALPEMADGCGALGGCGSDCQQQSGQASHALRVPKARLVGQQHGRLGPRGARQRGSRQRLPQRAHLDRVPKRRACMPATEHVIVVTLPGATLSQAKSAASLACERAAVYRQADIVMDAFLRVATSCSRVSPVPCTLTAPTFFSTAPTTASQHITQTLVHKLAGCHLCRAR